MIKNLTINNFVLIDYLEIDFSGGLNVLTGETGSGKSLIIDAIDLVFGSRASKDQIKTGEAKAVLELTLEISKDFDYTTLEENGIDLENGNTLIISREITSNSTRSRINGVMVSQMFVQSLRSSVIDIHSQHETYNYLQPKTHINLLDNYGDYGHKELLTQYTATFEQYKSVKNRYETAIANKNSNEQQIDYLKYQIEEISNADISDVKEYDNLTAERNVLVNAEELKETAMSGYEALYNQEYSVVDALNSIKSNILKACRMDENLSSVANSLETASIELKEASDQLRNYADNLDTDPQQLMEIENRINVLDKLKRKFGGSLEAVLATLGRFQQELSEIDISDDQIEGLHRQSEELFLKTKNLGDALTNSRKTLAERLSWLIQEKLVKLEMPRVEFKITVGEASEYLAKGRDEVEFLISPNPGEPLKPLAKIASGGEISRVILAIKTIFAQSDNVNTVIFDEIDTGISGKTSQAVAEAMAELGISQQVICITHQPIIAAMADNHLFIRKITNNKNTKVEIDVLNHDQKIRAVASLASGSAHDYDSLNFAASLIDQSKTFKESFKIKKPQTQSLRLF